ncbi:MFS transporter [Conexibacter sp. SYSU D00693]|uniref:MFS transporter n=1 Tax=Conexibacter sp. SYSU D00693 TaxID=2812560 RepID=UPI00196AD7E6|nr:MFS transporter [Conexibacter sp. SYSU D00693]
MSPLSVVRHRDFRRLWLAQAGSSLGDRVVVVALALYVTDTGSATDLGLVLTAQALPLVLLLLVGGVWADRLPRARLVLATDVVRAVVQTVVAVLVLTGSAEVWHLVVASLVFGSAEAFFRPAQTGLVPETVPEEDIQAARAVTSMTDNVAELAGPAIGTALVVGLSAGVAFAVDAVTFLVSALLVAGVRTRRRTGLVDEGEPSVPAPSLTALPEPAPSWRTELAEGWAEVRSRVWVWATILGATAALILAYGPLFVLGPTVAEEVHGDTAVFGWTMTAFGAGALSGAATGLRWRPTHPILASHVVALLWPLIGVCLAVDAPLVLTLAVAAAGGWGLSLFDVWWTTALSELIPPAALGRVSAFDWMGSLALLPVAYALAGPLADAVGAREVLAVGGIACVVTTALPLLARGVRELTWRSPPRATPGSP